MRRILLSVIFMSCLFNCFVLLAQEVSDLDVEDLKTLKIPPLEVLFENARKSPAVELYQVKMEEEASVLKTEKRSWLKYFKLSSSYQYGLMGVNSSFSDSDTPLFYQYSGATQNWYNVGVTLSVPFDDLFDRANRIKRQKLKTKATQVEIEKWHDEQKLRIIEVYTKAKKEFSILKLRIEMLSFANTQYELGEQDFLNGKIDVYMLNQKKSIQLEAIEGYESSKAEFVSALLQLEVLSRTKILNQ